MKEPQGERPEREEGVFASTAEGDAAGFVEVAHGNGNDPSVVLVVRMQHDNELGSVRERFPITRLLIASVAEVPFVANESDGKTRGDLHGSISARVVNHDDLVAATWRDVRDDPLESV